MNTIQSLTDWWPGGPTIKVEGTFTKDATGSVGTLRISLPTTSDEVIFMYGVLTMGGTKVGGAADTTITYTNSANAEMSRFATININAGEILNLPTAFADAAVAVDNDMGIHDVYGLMLTGTDHMEILCSGMANLETFILRTRWRSRSGVALTTDDVNGTFA